MADTKISALTHATVPLVGTEQFALADGTSVSKYATTADLFTADVHATFSDYTSQGTGTPASPTGAVRIFGRAIASRMMLGQIGPSGLDSALQPLLARNKVGYWNPPGNATTVPGVFGITAPTASGTATARNVATTNLANRMRRIGYPSATTAGSFAGARISVAQFSCGSGTAGDGSGFMMVERWVESDPASVTGRRAFAGMTSTTGAPSNVEPNTLTNAVGIMQLSSDATQWYWYGAGSSAAYDTTAVGTGIGAPAGNSTTAWELAIFCANTANGVYNLQLTNLSTGVIVTHQMSSTSAVNLPQSGTLLAWRHWVCNNATALAVGMDLCSLYFETDT